MRAGLVTAAVYNSQRTKASDKVLTPADIFPSLKATESPKNIIGSLRERLDAMREGRAGDPA